MSPIVEPVSEPMNVAARCLEYDEVACAVLVTSIAIIELLILSI
jgi:hypothetical protein